MSLISSIDITLVNDYCPLGHKLLQQQPIDVSCLFCLACSWLSELTV